MWKKICKYRKDSASSKSQSSASFSSLKGRAESYETIVLGGKSSSHVKIRAWARTGSWWSIAAYSTMSRILSSIRHQKSSVSVYAYGGSLSSPLFYLLYQCNMVHGARIKIKQCTCMALPNSKNKRDCFFLKKGTDLYRQYVARFEVHFSIHKI